MAVATTASSFTGFRPEAIQFLADLTANNDRAWFQPRKGEYERLLKEPLEALIAALAVEFAARDLPLRADPAKSPFRIYRDVRFAKDKSPYKTNIGASLPWVADPGASLTGRSETANVHSSGGYFRLSPGEIYIGGGYWRPEKAWLDAFRRRVAADPGALSALMDEPSFFATFGGLGRDGHVLQRVPTGFPPDHPAAETLKLKDIVFGRRLSDADSASPDLPTIIAETFVVARPLLGWLARIG